MKHGGCYSTSLQGRQNTKRTANRNKRGLHTLARKRSKLRNRSHSGMANRRQTPHHPSQSIRRTHTGHITMDIQKQPRTSGNPPIRPDTVCTLVQKIPQPRNRLYPQRKQTGSKDITQTKPIGFRHDKQEI